jgi:Protein NO VEIN, C-terminal
MNLEIRIKWLKGGAKGSVDVLPVNLFKDLAANSVLAHVVEFAGGGSDFAKFTARIQPRSATLNYTPHQHFNVARDMVLGTYELEFADDARKKLKAVAWDGDRLGPEYVVFGTVPIGKTPPRLRPTGSASAKGAGFGTPEQNARVEKAAIKAVRARLVSEGWTVRSAESEKVGYDLECINGKRCLHVEVKGIRGTKVSFILTNGERRRAAEDSQFQLVAVTSALSKPALHRYQGPEMERHFAFSTLQWRLDQR